MVNTQGDRRADNRLMYSPYYMLTKNTLSGYHIQVLVIMYNVSQNVSIISVC